MNFLILGLGSMGKRRIRCLQALGFTGYISGWDIRKDRCNEAKTLYGITIESELSHIDPKKYDCIIISVPPDHHNTYIKFAIDNHLPAFVEASVILEGLPELSELAKKQNVTIAPSCSMVFHHAIQDIRRIVRSGEYGKVTNFSYHCGQYLPDWHPWEKIQDFYVSKKETGGAREIVPFELTWIVDLLGPPQNIFGFFGRTFDMGVDIDDTYAISMDFGGFFGTMTIDVVSRYATRSLILNLEKAQICWNWDEKKIRVYDADRQRWLVINEPDRQTVAGYNKNISDEMYIRELSAFLTLLKGKPSYPNTLDKDIEILRLLNRVEGRI